MKITGTFISIIGTHGSGKTTLCYKVAHKLQKKGFKTLLIDEVVRKSPLPINQQANLYTSLWISLCQLLNEFEALLYNYDYIITDRSVIDTFAYYHSISNDNDYLIDCLQKLCITWLKHFNHKLFLLNYKKFNFLIDDGVRDLDNKFRKKVYYNIKKILDEYKLNYVTINSKKDIFNKL